MIYKSSTPFKLSEIYLLLTHELAKVSDSPEIEAELILCSFFKINKETLIKNNNKEVSFSEFEGLSILLDMRLGHRPLEYILRSKSFYGLDFYVDEGVLIPRPETELLVEEFVKNLYSSSEQNINILEIGIGSGCIFISIANEIIKNNIKIQCNFYLVDISEKAIRIAEKNLSTLLGHLPSNLNFHFYKADILPEQINDLKMNYIISNPPYIPFSEMSFLSTEVKHEPIIALEAKSNGMDIYKKILKQTINLVSKDTAYFFEIHYKGADKLKRLFNELLPNFKSIKVIKDLNKLDRIIIAKVA
jgi:release factor glutamine methyltransferase